MKYNFLKIVDSYIFLCYNFGIGAGYNGETYPSLCRIYLYLHSSGKIQEGVFFL